MSRESIIGSGRRGFGFEQKGFQERNLALLLETLSKKETQKSIEALSKIDKDEWIAMAATATTLNNFISLGGASTLISSIKETITLQIESILSPLTNEINQHITTILAPFISDILTPMINELNTFLSENQTGAGIGGIVGSVLGSFVPGGSIFGPLVGAIIGGVIEAMLTADITGAPDLTSTELIENYRIWLLNNPGGTIGDYYRYLQRGGGAGGLSLPGRTGGLQEDF